MRGGINGGGFKCSFVYFVHSKLSFWLGFQ